MKTQEEIVIETIQAYADPANRAVNQPANDPPRCVYRNHRVTPPTHCAVGRCMTEEALDKVSMLIEAFSSLPRYLNYNHHDELLRPDYQGHPMSFWILLQQLHDNTLYWIPLKNATNNHLHLRYNWLELHFPAALPRALELNLVKKP